MASRGGGVWRVLDASARVEKMRAIRSGRMVGISAAVDARIALACAA